MTEKPLNAVIASDRRERGNLVFRVTTQSPNPGEGNTQKTLESFSVTDTE
jgi:hypothetical protein